MKRLLILFGVLLCSTLSLFAQDAPSGYYPIWGVRKDSLDVWLNKASIYLKNALDAKMDTITANLEIANMRATIASKSDRDSVGYSIDIINDTTLRMIARNGTAISSVTIPSKKQIPAIAYGSKVLPLLTVGNTDHTINLNKTMPNTNYDVIVCWFQGTATLVGALQYASTVTKTTTSVTVRVNNTGIVSIAAGGTINITVVGTQ